MEVVRSYMIEVTTISRGKEPELNIHDEAKYLKDLFYQHGIVEDVNVVKKQEFPSYDD